MLDLGYVCTEDLFSGFVWDEIHCQSFYRLVCPMTQVITITKLAYAVGKKSILKDISLNIQKGDYLGIIGPNGAGKSTLLKCLMRINQHSFGQIEICGRPLADYSQRELATKLSYVPQSNGRALAYTVKEFVEMGRYPFVKPFSSMTVKDYKVVDDAIEQVGIGPFKHRSLATLSGGERQSVFIAAALAQGAKILLLDEPTTFLDPKHQADTHALLGRLNGELGLTIINVTHDINSAAISCNKVVAIKDGEVTFSGTGQQLMQNSVLKSIFGINFNFAAHPVDGSNCIVPARAFVWAGLR